MEKSRKLEITDWIIIGMIIATIALTLLPKTIFILGMWEIIMVVLIIGIIVKEKSIKLKI